MFQTSKELCNDMFWLQCGIGFICTLNRRINTWLQVLFEHYFIPVELFQRPKAHTITCVGIMNCPARCKCEPQGYPRYHEFHRDRWSPTSMRQRVLCSTWKLNFTDLKIKKAEKKSTGNIIGNPTVYPRALGTYVPTFTFFWYMHSGHGMALKVP